LKISVSDFRTERKDKNKLPNFESCTDRINPKMILF
jgi:hypothetical protein